MKNKLILSFCMLGVFVSLCAGPVFQVPKMANAPALNGKASDAWKQASNIFGFFDRRSSNLELRQGKTFFGYDDRNFYIAVQSELPPDGVKLLSSVRRRDGRVFKDDSIELWIAPEGVDQYYQYTVNSIGTVCDIKHDRTGKIPDETWSAKWKQVNYLDKKANLWIYEVAIPLKDLNITGKADGKKVRMLIARNWYRPWNQAPFIQNSAPFNDLKQYAEFVLNPDAPAIQVETIGGELEKQLFNLRGTVRNNSKKTQQYELGFRFTHSDMPETFQRRTIKAAPGETVKFAFDDDGSHIHLRASHKAVLTVKNGKNELYSAPFAFKLPLERENAWKIANKINNKFQFAVYPSFKKAAIRFDAEKNADSAFVAISLNGKTVCRKKFAPIKAENTFYFDIPDLADGNYDVALSVFAGAKKIRTAVQKFERRVFPWENNKLGISDKVYAPFKDIVVNGNSLKTVCNEYVFASDGLYADIKPGNKSIMRGQVSYNFMLNGKQGKFTSANGKFVKKSAAECIFDGEAVADGGFKVRTLAKTEYDGCTRFEVTLAPVTGKTPLIEQFYMDIPLDDKQLKNFHIIKSGHIRTNPAVRIPRGEGVVWRSSDVANGDFYGNMHIYLWLGNVDRGISWFADNDRNFSLDDNKPAQVLIRKGDTLVLRVYFVNKTLKLASERTIVFGMQASPVKPMPVDFRNPVLKIPPHGGSNRYWGIRPSYAGKYPVGYDWEYVDRMVIAREKGKIDSKYIEGFLKKHYGTLPESLFKNYRGHAFGGHLSMMANVGKNPTMLYFEEHCQDQTTPEWNTFQDEWSLYPFSTRKWLKEEDMTTNNLCSSAGIIITPVKSYRDFTLHYAREWYRRGVGIYCDNVFPRTSNDIINSNAYIRPDGNLQPSSDIWDMREYHKRLWVLSKEMQSEVRWPLMISLHVTNAMILPVVCWTDIQLDLEWGWASGYKPFPIELLEIETTGRQLGAYPQVHFPIVGCGLVHEDPTYLRGKVDKDMMRTDWAMRMIFGALRYSMRGENFDPLNKIVYDLGMGTAACKVYDYWQDDYPVIISSDEVKSILLRNGSKAILVLASWSEKPLDLSVTLQKTLKIVNANGRFPVEKYSVKNNSFKLTLGKYGMQLITMEVK